MALNPNYVSLLVEWALVHFIR